MAGLDELVTDRVTLEGVMPESVSPTVIGSVWFDVASEEAGR